MYYFYPMTELDFHCFTLTSYQARESPRTRSVLVSATCRICSRWAARWSWREGSFSTGCKTRATLSSVYPVSHSEDTTRRSPLRCGANPWPRCRVCHGVLPRTPSARASSRTGVCGACCATSYRHLDWKRFGTLSG